MPRLPIDKIYMQVAYQFAKLSYAERRKVGSVIVKDTQIVSFGYNGTTVDSKGADLYVTMSPCFQCSKLIIQSGIKNVFYSEEYRDTKGIELLKKANINVNKVIVWNEF